MTEPLTAEELAKVRERAEREASGRLPARHCKADRLRLLATLDAQPATTTADMDWIADVQRRFGLDDSASSGDVWRAHERMVEEAEAEGHARGCADLSPALDVERRLREALAEARDRMTPGGFVTVHGIIGDGANAARGFAVEAYSAGAIRQFHRWVPEARA